MKRRLMTMLVAALAAGSLAGCGPVRDEASEEMVAALTPEGAALASLGFNPEELAAGDPVAADEPDPADGPRWRTWRARHAVRVVLRRHVLHGEVVVQTPDGTKTVLVQRGEVSAISETGLTVTSTDGFSQSWVYAEELRVIESRSTVTPSELTAGATVGVAGVRVDGEATARLIIIPKA